jgi:hypothetical protein
MPLCTYALIACGASGAAAAAASLESYIVSMPLHPYAPTLYALIACGAPGAAAAAASLAFFNFTLWLNSLAMFTW